MDLTTMSSGNGEENTGLNTTDNPNSATQGSTTDNNTQQQVDVSNNIDIMVLICV